MAGYGGCLGVVVIETAVSMPRLTIHITIIKPLAVKRIAPGIDISLLAAKSILPFRFRWQSDSGPLAIVLSIIPVYTHNRMLRFLGIGVGWFPFFAGQRFGASPGGDTFMVLGVGDFSLIQPEAVQ